MVDKSDVLLMCGGEALILLTVCQAGWGRPVVLLNAEHDPGCREAEGGKVESQPADVDGTGPEFFRDGGGGGGGGGDRLKQLNE